MLILPVKEERLLGFHPLFLLGWVHLVALECLLGLGKLQYLLALAHFLPIAMEMLGIHPLLVQFFEEKSSFFCHFPFFLRGDSIQLVYPVGIPFLA